MGVDVSIRKKGLFKKSISFYDFIELLEEDDYFLISKGDGISEEVDDDWVYSSGEAIIIYNNDQIGRGFEIAFHNKEVELRLPFPCTESDIEIFYQYIKYICDEMNVSEFEQDGEMLDINEIEDVEEYIYNFNKSQVINLLSDDERKGTTIFGAYFPINIEDKLFDEVKLLTEDEIQERFDDYLDELQQQDVYYARNLLIEFDDGTTAGIYAICEGVTSVLPSKDTFYTEKPDKQFVALVHIDEESNEPSEAFEVTFEDLKKVINFENCPKFDEGTVLVTVTSQNVEELLKYQCEVE